MPEVKRQSVIMDEAYFSPDNISQLMAKHNLFQMAVPAASPTARTYIQQVKDEITERRNLAAIEDYRQYVAGFEVILSNNVRSAITALCVQRYKKNRQQRL